MLEIPEDLVTLARDLFAGRSPRECDLLMLALILASKPSQVVDENLEVFLSHDDDDGAGDQGLRIQVHEHGGDVTVAIEGVRPGRCLRFRSDNGGGRQPLVREILRLLFLGV